MVSSNRKLSAAKKLSPLRNSTGATSVKTLTREQLQHFNIDPGSDLGKQLEKVVSSLYEVGGNIQEMLPSMMEALKSMNRSDRIAFFNAKRFMCFQMAKCLDDLQIPLRKSYQSLIVQQSTHSAKGPYAMFDNIPAIFCATPVITRTATYIYACTEWIDEAFKGKELLHEIYSRLMNPTSIALANHIVDIEAGPLSGEYFAWNFNSGMAAIDCIFSHLVGYRDIVLSSRNVYGGSYQLLKDWYGKNSNLDIAVEWFDGFTGQDFMKALKATQIKYADRLSERSKIYVFIESPCNPHGYFLDVAAICKVAHMSNCTVVCDSTVGTPFLQPTLRNKNSLERPDFVVHSYTKDLTGTGTTTAGVVIGRNEAMFLPKGESVEIEIYNKVKKKLSWDQTLFWNVYYIKGAFLDADKAFEVITGMKTLELRMLRKCIHTVVFSRVLAAHPDINVNCSAVPGNENHALMKKTTERKLPAPLFTIDFEEGHRKAVSRETFTKFFDCLEPVFGLQVSLGQVNTVVLCPALTSHSEMSVKALEEAGIAPTTIRIAVGEEDPRVLLAHFIRASSLTIDQDLKGFSKKFMSPQAIDDLYQKTYISHHRAYLKNQPTMKEMLS